MPSSSSSTALVSYRPSKTLASTVSSSLLPSRLFTAQTGHALATELLYRLLFDLLNRLLASLHRFATHQLDTFASFLERKALARRQQQQTRISALGNHSGKLSITEEVGKAAAQRGFVTGGGPACPTTGKLGKRPGWVGEVLEGIDQGRLVERDFWGHPFGN